MMTNSSKRLLVGAFTVLAAGTASDAMCAGGATAAGPGSATAEFRYAAATTSESDGKGAAITFVTRPDPPRSGDNAVEAVVVAGDGTPVVDAQVTAVFSMPAMPSMNMPAMHSDFVLRPVGTGRYVGTGQLVMAGTWNVSVTVRRGGKTLASKRFSVIAK